ncbi:MAG: fumarylacetoacetate hydrolase family protein [Chloroflexi bacterium]|nr:fumarylacetoacetate hydrolase family protein [Chloroflexota bacterium]
MRFIRYQFENNPPQYGWLHEGQVGPLDGSPFEGYRRQEASIALEQVRLLAPVLPQKIVCVGRNYADHAREQDAEIPEIPLLFLKPPSSIIAHQSPIYLPPQSRQVDHEAELAVVIGRTCRWVSSETALSFVFGYTIANDVTARDLQRKDGQWTRAKGFDTFCPLGPWIETDFDPADALITCRVNEELRQMSSTREMIFTISQLIAFVSSIMTLEPGDLLLTGTPAGVGPLQPGDMVDISIEGIGSLRNPVRSSPSILA